MSDELSSNGAGTAKDGPLRMFAHIIILGLLMIGLLHQFNIFF